MFSDVIAKPKAPKQGPANNDVRLNPVPAGNTLLTIVFFSLLAAALLYWIFFPPATPSASDHSTASTAQSAQRD